MKFCQECGEVLEFCGKSAQSSGVWLHGCPKCDILWEAHGGSLTGTISNHKKNFMKLSAWKEQTSEGREFVRRNATIRKMVEDALEKKPENQD